MSSFIFKKFEEPPNPDRLCDEDDRRLFFWDGDGTGGQADNWGTTDPDGIDALFYEKLDGSGPNDQLNQLLSVDSQGRVVNYIIPAGSAAPDLRGVGSIDLQFVRTTSSQIASGDFSVLLGGASNEAPGFGSVVIGGSLNIADGGGPPNNGRSVVVGGQNNQANSARSVVLGGEGLEASINNTAVVQNLQLQGGAANSSFFAVTTSGTATNQATIQIRNSSSDIDVSSSDPDGTVIVVRNNNILNSITFTNPLGDFVSKPTGSSGGANELSLAANGSAILYKSSNNLVVISYYNPATA